MPDASPPSGLPQTWASLFETLPVGVLITDADGRLVDVNAAALALFELTRDELLGRTSLSPAGEVVCEDGTPLPDDEHPAMVALRTGEKVSGKVVGIRQRKSGKRVWVEVNAIPEFRPGDATPSRVLVALHDITARRRAEAALHDSETRWHALVEQAGDSVEVQDEDGRFLQVNTVTCASLGYTREELLGMTIFDVDPQVRPEVFRSKFRDLIGQPAATFESVHRRKDGSEFPVEITTSVIHLGDRWRALAHVRDITQRKRNDAEIRAANELLGLVLDSLEAHVAVLDGKGNIIAVNEPWRRFARENGIAETVGTVEQVNYLEVTARSSLHSSRATADICRGLEDVLGGRRPSFQAEYPCDSPTEPRWFRMHILALRNGQQGAVVTHEDITVEKLALDSLRQAHDLLNFAQQGAGAGVWEWDLVSGALTWSPELFRLYGLDPAQDRADFETWRRVMHPEDLKTAEARIPALLAEGKPFADEYRILLPDGEIRWVQAQGSIDVSPDGRPLRMAGICLDCTRQKLAEDALAASEVRARIMLRTAMDGVWLIDDQGRFREANEAACRMVGYPAHELLGMTVAELEAQESPEEVRAHLAAIASKGWDLFESRLRRKDGTEFPVEVSVTSQPDLSQIVVFVRDITARKRVDEALRESEARLRAIVENSRDAIGVSRSGIHVMVNPAYREMFGFEAEADLTGLPILDLIAPEDRETIIRYGQDRAANRPVPSHYEVTALHQDGSPFQMEVRASTYDLGGEVFTLVILRDITVRKHKEAVLRESEARFRTMFEDSPIGIWEEDFSEVKASFEALCRDGVVDFRAYLALHPEEVVRLAGLVRVLRINRASVLCLKAASEDEIVRNLPSYFTPASLDVFREALLALLAGETYFRMESPHLDAHGGLLEFDISFTLEAGQEASLSRVLVSFVDITDRKAMESALRLSELQARESMLFNERLLTTMPIGAVVYHAESGQCLMANEAIAHYIGGSRESLLRQNFRTLPSWEQSGLLAAAERVISAGGEEHVEIHLRSTFGKDCWLSCDFSTFESLQGKHLLVLSVDITERKQSNLALLQSERKYRSLFDSMKEGFALHEILLDDQGLPCDYRFLDVNPAFVAMTGVPRNQWIGRTVREILPGTEARWIREYGQVALTGMPITFEEESRDLGRWYRVTAYRPAPRQFAVLVTDITEAKRLEVERLQLEQQVTRTQKMESLGSLAGGVAHDMNNVLGAIMGLASIHQEQSPDGSKLHKSMATILKACTRGRTLVKGLLGFARQGLEEVRVLDLNEVVREDIALLERTIPASVRIELDLAPALQRMHGDPAALSHVLMNLCLNAVDAMPAGGTLRLSTRNEDPDQISLEVADTGCGMSPEVLERALDPFFTTKGQGKGTGLGLAIVYGTVKAHHGQLELSSVAGTGTRALLRFPATAADPALGTPSLGRLTTERSLSVLVVDDDELIQDSLAELFRSMGHRPTVARSGEEALQLLEQGLAAEVVLLDLNMPGLGGAGTLPRLRAGHPDLPVLLATGRADQSAMDLVAHTTKTVLLPKPFSSVEITSHFRQLGLT